MILVMLWYIERALTLDVISGGSNSSRNDLPIPVPRIPNGKQFRHAVGEGFSACTGVRLSMHLDIREVRGK